MSTLPEPGAALLPSTAADAAVVVQSSLQGVELQLFDLDRLPINDAGVWLSPAEVSRAARFVFDRDARRFSAAHVALRRVLAARCGLAPRAEFEVSANGKPRLPFASGCSFNLSHSGAFALVGTVTTEGHGTAKQVGVDIESTKHFDDLELLAQNTLTQGELAELTRECSALKVQAFLRGWTRKEACLKAVGSGLTVDAKSVEVGLGTDERTVTFRVGAERRSARVASLDVGGGMLAAVALTDAMSLA